ncbi:hypothetical protein G9464_04560 [Halostella sp. JP-L12]|uniref:hypothetical protein n=1 Tax=Halostella TaxID=1843185 RepID=UPI000EF84FEE|nr:MULTISPECIES: hypothetical protein [Halostella]NHN46868.1 hypothetical protein [Halostella sp. JP-L12]
MPASERGDRHGLDDTRDHLRRLLGSFVPQWLARRAVAVEVRTDADRYEAGDSVEMAIAFKNRLPVPVTVDTPGKRLWGWTVDGELEASDEPRKRSTDGGSISFSPRERKEITRTWDGRFKRVDDRTRWVPADPGTYEIAAFLALDGDRPSDATTIRIE